MEPPHTPKFVTLTLLLNSLERILTIKMHSSFHIKDPTTESPRFIGSLWIRSCVSRSLCISIATGGKECQWETGVRLCQGAKNDEVTRSLSATAQNKQQGFGGRGAAGDGFDSVSEVLHARSLQLPLRLRRTASSLCLIALSILSKPRGSASLSSYFVALFQPMVAAAG